MGGGWEGQRARLPAGETARQMRSSYPCAAIWYAHPPDAPACLLSARPAQPCGRLPPPAGRNGLKWTADLAAIDLHYYLPIFVDGLLETQAR